MSQDKKKELKAYAQELLEIRETAPNSFNFLVSLAARRAKITGAEALRRIESMAEATV